MRIRLTRNLVHYLLSLVVHVMSTVGGKQVLVLKPGKFDFSKKTNSTPSFSKTFHFVCDCAKYLDSDAFCLCLVENNQFNYLLDKITFERKKATFNKCK